MVEFDDASDVEAPTGTRPVLSSEADVGPKATPAQLAEIETTTWLLVRVLRTVGDESGDIDVQAFGETMEAARRWVHRRATGSNE